MTTPRSALIPSGYRRAQYASPADRANEDSGFAHWRTKRAAEGLVGSHQQTDSHHPAYWAVLWFAVGYGLCWLTMR
jgi:hypothetical protein